MARDASAPRRPVTRPPPLALVPALGLLGALALFLAGLPPAPALWAGTLPVLGALLLDSARSVRRGEWGLDLIAGLAMGFGLALGEPLASCVVALMFAGGRALEAFAQRRAAAEMTALLARQPRSALRQGADGSVEEVPLAALAPGDLVLVPRGATLPVDGTVEGGTAVLDTAALTGEAMPVRRGPGEAALSGSVNAGDAFVLRAATDAAASTWAGIVRLVEAAQASRAPMARLADRWSVAFLALTLLLAGGAWALSGEAERALAVLVVATPCPLILAVPVALVAGMSRAAKLGLLAKSAAALEALARVRAVVLDKTGTLTEGAPRLVAVAARGMSEDEALRLAASLDQVSDHPVARAIVAEARARGLALAAPEATEETPGEGVRGTVGGLRLAVGGARWTGRAAEIPDPPREPGAMRAALAVEGGGTAALILADPLRAEAAATVAGLRALGVRHVAIASGDAPGPVEAAARAVGADAALSALAPADKVAVVARAREAHGGPVLMLGDGLNDAPALAAADLGVAVGARGAAAAAEAAEAVLVAGGLDRLLAAMRAARRARAIALQSVAAGLALSTLGMVAASLGYLSPVQGALIQEGIDVAVILHALRALRA